MSEKEKQPYKDIREHLKDSNFNNVVMEAFELMCGETVEMDLQFDNYPMARTKYLETEASKKSIDFSEKYHGTSVVVKLALEQREELLKWKDSQQDLIKSKDEYIAKLCNDRAELKEHEKELIAEQYRLFNLAKEQENELKKLKENYAKLEINCANKLQDNDLIVHIAVDDLKKCQNANKKLLEENQKLNQKPQFPNTNLWDNQELNELQEFVKLISEKRVNMSLFRDYDLDIYEYNNDYVEDEFRLTQKEFDLVKKVVEKYGKK